MTSLTGAGYPANLFVVNPTIAGGGAFVLTNSGSSYYNAGIVEVRRRLSSGVQLQASYTWAKALANAATASATDFSTPTTLRNRNLDKVPEAFDIRNAIKINGIYELPFGPGRRFNSSNVVARKIMEGWQIAGVARFQSGTPFFLTGLPTFNQTGGATGVVLHNITSSQLQSLVGVYKTGLSGRTAESSIICRRPPPHRPQV